MTRAGRGPLHVVGLVAVALAVLAGAGAAWLAHLGYGRRLWFPYHRNAMGAQTRDEVVGRIGPRHRPGLERDLRALGLAYPPTALTLLGVKDELRLEVRAARDQGWSLLRDYPVLAASGGPGPKLRQGDRQVPEGVYRLTHLNPASSYHLSVRVDYPNEFDRDRAREDGRTDLGGDIYVHGKAVSVGCLALGDEAIEELFTLIADTGLARSRIVLVPSRTLAVPPGAPAWTGRLYEVLAAELRALEGPVPAASASPGAASPR